ncbi:Cullin-associated NEDD8-dissociated protein 1 C-terminal part [Penicillium citrinum]|uniref:Cullin-associated NEDD8-dissociated protein 1 C-terminal part n=1 Tax=Penicillium citrinum TaxID=5077 RepID=A0A9W9TV06_PENCI|nr:Cullin-associated NEDD8-dissociated protein 1 C-terminal part [Penicillium citrinum]KAJ5241658.1 Cullin-associated NEDD8-dissociated protein 1 C-terminal part [Penicillium citrinum]
MSLSWLVEMRTLRLVGVNEEPQGAWLSISEKHNLLPKLRPLLETALLPLLSAPDFHLLTPTLIIISEAYSYRLKVASSHWHLKVIGEEGAGAQLMQNLLQNVGITGDSTVVGRAIGTLLGVTMDDFSTELRTAEDDSRKCLACHPGGNRLTDGRRMLPDP